MDADRGDRNITWIEKYCLYPSGPDKGQHVRLSQHQRDTIRRMYDNGPKPIQVSGTLAAYLVLLHVCGPEALLGGGPQPHFKADIFTTWNATSPHLRAVLKRSGKRIVCPELKTVMAAARVVPIEKRSQFLERIAAMLRLRGRGHFNDDDVANAVARALNGMTHSSAA